MALPLGICLSNLYVHICDCRMGKMLQLHACLVRSGRSSMERRPLFRCLGASTSSREFVLSILEMQSRKGSKREWPMRLSHCTWAGRLRWIGVGPPLWRPRTNGYGTEGGSAGRDAQDRPVLPTRLLECCRARIRRAARCGQGVPSPATGVQRPARRRIVNDPCWRVIGTCYSLRVVVGPQRLHALPYIHVLVATLGDAQDEDCILQGDAEGDTIAPKGSVALGAAAAVTGGYR